MMVFHFFVCFNMYNPNFFIQLYILLYGLSLLHGLQKLTSAPTFWMFFVGPAIIYTFDKFMSLRISYMELHVLETELLPSDVIKITFYRPPNFDFRSGQWVRVCCESMGQTGKSYMLLMGK